MRRFHLVELVRIARLASLACLAASLPAMAQQTIVVIGSATTRAAHDAPFAISVVDRDEIRRAGPMINASEALVRVPGLVASNRSNYSQDLQVSSRGFGARATFGVRGLRLYADGIPATGPDGQGQVSHFDLASAERIEVLRGPFSALYGNSSGGVIAVHTAPVTRTEVAGRVGAGSFGLFQLGVEGSALLGGGLDLRASASTMRIDGFRPQSGADKHQAAARLGWRTGAEQLTVMFNHLDQPADDPLGLTREQFDLGPEETTVNAITYDTRKKARQTQLGASWRHRWGEGLLRESTVAAYAGTRSITQFLSIPPFVQLASPLQGGGVVDFDRRFDGVDARVRLGGGAFDLVVGAALERQRDDRRGWENFVGSGDARVLGVFGALRRDEVNHASTTELYAQAQWALAADLEASAGLRSGRVELSSRDAFLANGDDSGRVDDGYTTPVAALRWRAGTGLNLYASFGRGHESPTLGEVAYRADGSGGFNDELEAQKSRQIELGAKWRSDGLALDLAVFEARTRDELGVVASQYGRSAFGNVGRTLRRGVEAALDWRPAPAWRTQLVASTLDATYRNDFLDCDGTPCGAGNRIAGAPRGSAWAEVAWADARWGEFGVEWRAVGRAPVDDRNTDAADGYATAALRWSKRYPLGAGGAMEWLLRVDNLFDRHHAASMIVNDGNRRFFEPGAPRHAFVGLRLSPAH